MTNRSASTKREENSGVNSNEKNKTTSSRPQSTRNAKEIVGHLYNDFFARNQKRQEMISNAVI